MNFQSIRKFLEHYRPAWYLDALIFWAVFSCGAIFVLWLFNITTKTQMRQSMEHRIYALTQTAAKMLDPHVLGVEDQAKNPASPIYLQKASNLIHVFRGQNPEILDIALLEIRGDQLWIFNRDANDWEEYSNDADVKGTIYEAAGLSTEQRGFATSKWGFLKNQILFFFTPPSSKTEFTMYPIAGWWQVNPDRCPLVMITFDAAGMRSELVIVDVNSSNVIFLSILLATAVSIVVRRRSIQREEAVEERFATLELLRHRDQILGASITAADCFIVDHNLVDPLCRFLEETNKVFNATSIFLRAMPDMERPSLGFSENKPIGLCDPTVKHFEAENLDRPEWSHWKSELLAGRAVIGTMDRFPLDEAKRLRSLGIRSIVIIPIISNQRLIAVLIIEHHHEFVIWEPGLIDTLSLTARLFGTAMTRHENEIHLRNTSKMEALGRMGGGVAHEFNNLLHIVIGNLAILSSKLVRQPEELSMVENMLKATRRGSKIINQLLSATRQSEADFKEGNLNEAVERTVVLAEPTLPKTVRLSLHLNPSLPAVMLDESLIQQVILNLILNARDAIEGEGRIDIHTGTDKIYRNGKECNYVFFRILDSGTGIPEKILESIFDPFFTTKPQGKGTGLGLSTSRGILELHKGFIEAMNQSGGGAIFTFYLQVSSGEISKSHHETLPSAQKVDMSGQSVLLADDEEMCLELVKDILSESGFRTLIAKCGEDLVEIAAQKKAEIDWVITDWSMPGLSGRKLVQRVREILPQTKIIVTSGLMLHEEYPKEINGFIQKPFQPHELLELMQKISRATKSV